MQLSTPLAEALATTKNHLKALAEIGIITVEDLLNYFPRAYSDLSNLKKISELTMGEAQTVVGVIRDLKTIRTRTGKTLVTAKLTDDTGELALTWFHSLYVARVLRNGEEVAITGKVQIGMRGRHSIIGGTFEKISSEMLHTGRIIPVYRSHGKHISSKWLREKIHPLLQFAKKLPEIIPPQILEKEDLPPLGESVASIHFPESEAEVENARQRLAFDELFFLQLAGLQRKIIWQRNARGRGTKIPHTTELLQEFASTLPFTFTSAQKASSLEILQDLQKDLPMNRLLEGDVGSGKTVVAALAIFLTVRAGKQVALLAPTEILAAQHFRNFLQTLHPLGIRAELLMGSTTAKNKKTISAKLCAGELDLVVGTHALLEAHVRFRELGLVVIDEQHRFGVAQRALMRKDAVPHVLSLTATPIPRTLALTIFGDQDISIIGELPPGRKPAITRLVPKEKREDSYRWIESEVEKGRQVFIVCPLVEESEMLEVKSAKTEFQRLVAEVFPRFQLGLLHGKMKPKDKDAVMQDFAHGKIQILVATTVIEVGIDVPNASIMLIEAADRFGLAQLHQLRGRVGRGQWQSYCFLFSESDSEEALTRLHALEKISNGFELAEMDLRLRGPGEVFGVRQSGVPDLRVARFSDVELIKKSRAAAEELLQTDAELTDCPLLRERLQLLEEQQENQ